MAGTGARLLGGLELLRSPEFSLDGIISSSVAFRNMSGTETTPYAPREMKTTLNYANQLCQESRVRGVVGVRV